MSLLDQLKTMTVVVADTGDFEAMSSAVDPRDLAQQVVAMVLIGRAQVGEKFTLIRLVQPWSLAE